jgi:thiosulfate/3-mercaptopyruvate sulfurtransferase
MRLSPIIETVELLKIYQHTDMMIFDVSTGKNARANYEQEHIPGAYFVDLNTQLADIKNDFADGGRHPLPTAAAFAKTLTDLGISKNKHIVIYDDNNGSNAAARFWWMLKSAGHEKVQVLNGGINEAKKNNFPMSATMEIIKPASESYVIDQWMLPTIEMQAVENISQNPDYLVIDVRSKERYDGKIEPIDLIAGHIPGAVNMPFTENINDQGLFLDPQVLRNKYEQLFNHIKSENIIVHCGSGVTACHTLLALAYAEMDIPKLYVGSWSEWSRNDKTMSTTI